MADVVFEQIIDVLLQTVGVGDKTQGRVGDQHPKNIAQPTYPMVTLFRSNEGSTERWVPGDYFPVLITTYSNISTDEAMNIHKAIKGALHNAVFQRGGAGFVTRASHQPVTTFDDTAEIVYLASVTYEIDAVGL